MDEDNAPNSHTSQDNRTETETSYTTDSVDSNTTTAQIVESEHDVSHDAENNINVVPKIKELQEGIETDIQIKSEEKLAKERVTILERLDDLRKRKRENEYFIRVSEQAIRYRMQEMKREIKHRYNQIRRIRFANNQEVEAFEEFMPQMMMPNAMSAGAPTVDTLVASPDIPMTSNDPYESDISGSEIENIRAGIDEIKERKSREIEEIRFDIEEKRIENLEIEDLMRNKWGPANTRTVGKWIKESNMQNFIYERIREKMQRKFKRLTLLIMVLSGIQSLLNVSNFGLSEEDYPTIVLVLKIIVTVISTFTFIVTTYIKDSKIEEIIQSYTSYIERLENFLSNLVTIADVKPELRPDGDVFVSENRETYAGIYRDSPYISKGYWNTGMSDYKSYVLDADPEKELYCSRKRSNYAFFARQESEDGDAHSIWSRDQKGMYAMTNYATREYASTAKKRKFHRRTSTPSKGTDYRKDINKALRDAEQVNSSLSGHHGLTNSTDEETGVNNNVTINTKQSDNKDKPSKSHRN
jgi:hypothetical protein